MEKETNKTQATEQKKFILIPTQKTFIFWFKSGLHIDYVINKWLIERTMSKQTPMLGKVSASFGRTIIVFMYSTSKEVK